MANWEGDTDFLDEEDMARFLDDQESSFENGCNNVSTSSTSSEGSNLPTKIYDNPSFYHLKILKKYFGHSNFRPMQWQIISSLMRDKRDNCAIMSTGYGKSLCYQYPAVYSGGVTLVISPLISLMEDQVLSLKVANISACLLGTAQTEKTKVLEQIFDKKVSVIYLTPEFATGEYGLDLLKEMKTKLDICLLAVDEAHCISSWGHDFRAQYRNLGSVRDILPDVPILAITATATKQVEADIIRSLRLKNPQVLHSGCDRPNLYLEVHHKNHQGTMFDFNKVLELVNNVVKFPGSTIVYCLTRKITENITEILQARGIICAAYHAGKSLKERKEAHEKFLKDQLDAIVATSAFGMGIDKPDIRCIVHYGTPSSIEAYYQEIGRAGRDGEPSRCVLFYSEADFRTHSMIADKGYSKIRQNQKEEMSQKMRDYLLNTECRRAYILSYFGENYTSKNKHCCDVCYYKNSGISQKFEGVDAQGRYDFSTDAQKMLQSIDALNGNYGFSMYILFLRGSKGAKLRSDHKTHPLHGCGKDKSDNWWKSIGNILLVEKYIQRNSISMKGFTNFTFCLTEKGKNFIHNSESKLLLKPTSDILSQLKNLSNSGNELQTKAVLIQNVVQRNKQDEIDKKLYSTILERRNQIADEKDCMPHNVISIPDIKELIRVKPRSLEQLSKCKLELFSEFKIHQFGQEFIDIIVEELGPGGDLDNNPKKSIVEALLQVPFTGRFPPTAEISYNLFKQGLSIQAISQQRNVTPGTIFSHLLDSMKKGLPIKLEQLGINEVSRLFIMRAILETPGTLLTPIKEKCPPEITWDQIRAVLAYMKIRDHLEEHQLDYEDFEDFTYEDFKSEAGSLDMQSFESQNIDKFVPKTSKADEDLDEFLKICSDLIKEDELLSQNNEGNKGEKRKLDTQKDKNENEELNKQNNLEEITDTCQHDAESSKIQVDSDESDDEMFKSPPRSAFGDSPQPYKIPRFV